MFLTLPAEPLMLPERGHAARMAQPWLLQGCACSRWALPSAGSVRAPARPRTSSSVFQGRRSWKSLLKGSKGSFLSRRCVAAAVAGVGPTGMVLWMAQPQPRTPNSPFPSRTEVTSSRVSPRMSKHSPTPALPWGLCLSGPSLAAA